jgi:ankyrin repeat protein
LCYGEDTSGRVVSHETERSKSQCERSEYREKTSLYIAAADDRNDIVEMLLKFGSDVNAKSDGVWIPLYNVLSQAIIHRTHDIPRNSSQE